MVLVAGLAIAPAALAQEKTAVPAKAPAMKTLAIGDPAPKLQVEKFVKGAPVTEFKKGHIYVVEFWATWCGPCIKGIPHLTEVQQSHKDKVTIIGVNIWEEKNYDDETFAQVKKFVDEMGDKMNYTVAYDGKAAAMDAAYMKAAGRNGIPSAFVVDGEGRIAFIGHPSAGTDMKDTINGLIAGTFDMKAATEKGKRAAEDARIARESQGKVQELSMKAHALMEEGKIDEGFKTLDEIVALQPQAKSSIAMTKFGYLLEEKKDYDRAYKLGHEMTESFKDDSMVLNGIAWTIVDTAGLERRDLDLAMKAATRADELTKSKDGAILDTLARVYWEKGDKKKAIELQEKAVAGADAGMKEDLEATLKKYKADMK